MLQQAKQEVPSLELGPPSPDWMDLLIGSPLGGLKTATRHEANSSGYRPARTQQLTSEVVVARSATPVVQESLLPPRRIARETSSASRAGTTNCESRKRTKNWSSQSSNKRDAKRRRVLPSSGEKTPIAESEEWGTTLTADALSETFLVPSTMDMERDATEEFMNEFWGDVMLDTSPFSNDSLVAAACPFDELRLPLPPAAAASQPDAHLVDDLTQDQLLELAQFIQPDLSEADTIAFDPALAELPPLPAPVTAEAPVAAPIDLAALLEQTEIVFSSELISERVETVEPVTIQTASLLPAPVCSPPPLSQSPAPVAVTAAASVASAAEPTHYILVLSDQQQTPVAAAAPSVTSATSVTSDVDVDDDSVDDPEYDDAAETEAEELPAARKRAARRAPAATPAEKYRRIRDNNNEASRRSRQQRKLREVDTEARVAELEAENEQLRRKAEVLEGLLEQVKALAPLLTAKR